jgi:CO dehydrogenase/acetyl-CoA synthase epsilon subunit
MGEETAGSSEHLDTAGLGGQVRYDEVVLVGHTHDLLYDVDP